MLPTQAQYWANQEQKRHNLATEALTRSELSIRGKEAKTKQQEADLKAVEALTNQERARIENVKALTAQTEAQTHTLAQQTNEARRLQDYELGLLQNEIAAQNARSTAIQAQASARQAESYASKADTETKLLPYSTGANVAASAGKAISQLAPTVSKAGKAIKVGVQSLLYNLRN